MIFPKNSRPKLLSMDMRAAGHAEQGCWWRGWWWPGVMLCSGSAQCCSRSPCPTRHNVPTSAQKQLRIANSIFNLIQRAGSQVCSVCQARLRQQRKLDILKFRAQADTTDISDCRGLQCQCFVWLATDSDKFSRSQPITLFLLRYTQSSNLLPNICSPCLC